MSDRSPVQWPTVDPHSHPLPSPLAPSNPSPKNGPTGKNMDPNLAFPRENARSDCERDQPKQRSGPHLDVPVIASNHPGRHCYVFQWRYSLTFTKWKSWYKTSNAPQRLLLLHRPQKLQSSLFHEIPACPNRGFRSSGLTCLS